MPWCVVRAAAQASVSGLGTGKLQLQLTASAQYPEGCEYQVRLPAARRGDGAACGAPPPCGRLQAQASAGHSPPQRPGSSCLGRTGGTAACVQPSVCTRRVARVAAWALVRAGAHDQAAAGRAHHVGRALQHRAVHRLARPTQQVRHRASRPAGSARAPVLQCRLTAPRGRRPPPRTCSGSPAFVLRDI